jgi:hypothetical protein
VTAQVFAGAERVTVTRQSAPKLLLRYGTVYGQAFEWKGLYTMFTP